MFLRLTAFYSCLLPHCPYVLKIAKILNPRRKHRDLDLSHGQLHHLNHILVRDRGGFSELFRHDYANPEKSTALSDQSFACTESKSRCCGFLLDSHHAFCQRVRRVCIRTSSAAVSGSVSAAIHSMRCLASSNKFATWLGSVELRADDEIRPSVAASPPRRQWVAQKAFAKFFSLLFFHVHSIDRMCSESHSVKSSRLSLLEATDKIISTCS